MALERIGVKTPATFDPTNDVHVRAMIAKVSEQKGPGWEVQSYDPESHRLTLTRTSALTEVRSAVGKDRVEVSIGRDVKVSDGERIAQRLEAMEDYQGMYLSEFKPHVGRGVLTRMNEAELRCRDAIANVLGVPRWEVQVEQETGGGFTFVLPPRYSPSRHEAGLQEVAENIVGREGWYVEVDAQKLTGQIIPAEPSTFEPVISYPFEAPITDAWSVPIGERLGGLGEGNTPLEMDLSGIAGILVSGTAGGGKDQPLDHPLPVPLSEKFPTGWATIGDIAPGDHVYTLSGRPATVTSLSPVMEREVYELHLSDGQVIRTSETHLSRVRTRRNWGRLLKHAKDAGVELSRLRAIIHETDSGVGATAEQIAALTKLPLDKTVRLLARVGVPTHIAHPATPSGVPVLEHRVTLYPLREALTAITDAAAFETETDFSENMWEVRSTSEIADLLASGDQVFIPAPEPITGDEVDVPLDPYVLGAWIGAGDTHYGILSGIATQVAKNIAEAGYPELSERITASHMYGFEGLTAALQLAGIEAASPAIPAEYLRAHVDQRLALFQGLIDTCGTQRDGLVHLRPRQTRFTQSVLELVQSLGIAATVNERETRVTFQFDTCSPEGGIDQCREVVKVVATQETTPMRCLIVDDPTHLYLTGGFVPTHNSVSINSVIYGLLARGWEVAIGDVPHKAVDFEWMKPYVRDHGWGCDSQAHTVAMLAEVYEEKETRAALLKQYGAQKLQDLPDDVRPNPIMVIVDELTGLFTMEPIPKGLPKDHQLVVEAQQQNLEVELTKKFIRRIPAELRFVGIRILLASQISQSNTGVDSTIKTNMANRLLLGSNATKNQRGHALLNPDAVPEVPSWVQADKGAARGTGLFEFEGAEPGVFKSYFASTDEYRARLDALGLPQTSRPTPDAFTIAKHVPRLNEDDEDSGGYGRGPRQYEPWELGPDGTPLTGRERANAARHHATVVANEMEGRA